MTHIFELATPVSNRYFQYYPDLIETIKQDPAYGEKSLGITFPTLSEITSHKKFFTRIGKSFVRISVLELHDKPTTIV